MYGRLSVGCSLNLHPIYEYYGGIIMIMNIISVFTVAATAIVVGKIIVDEVKLHIVCQEIINKHNK